MLLHNLTGAWTGIIVYGNGYYGPDSKKVLYFDMDIIQQNEIITGSAIDTEGLYVNPTQATILGTFNDEAILFIKQYAGAYFIKDQELHFDNTTPSPEIYYSGIYNEQTHTFSGKWTFNKDEYLHGPISLDQPRGSGTWTMIRKSAANP